MTDSERFENLKKKVDSFKVRKMASESEAKRLSDELEKKKKEIHDVYNVDIVNFSDAIETMKKEYETKLNRLETLVNEAEQKMEGIK